MYEFLFFWLNFSYYINLNPFKKWTGRLFCHGRWPRTAFSRMRFGQSSYHSLWQILRSSKRVIKLIFFLRFKQLIIFWFLIRFAYIEFADKDSVQTAMALDDSLFKGRLIKVNPKRTNRPGLSSTNRARGGRGSAAGRGGRGGFGAGGRGAPWMGPFRPTRRPGRYGLKIYFKWFFSSLLIELLIYIQRSRCVVLSAVLVLTSFSRQIW